MSEPFDIARYNEAVRAFGREEKRHLQGSINSLGVRASGDLLRRLNVKFGQRYGQVNYIGFQFPRHGVFLEKGASRGHGGTKGGKWRTAKGAIARTNKDSMGRMGQGNRPARPWANPVLEPAVDRLATIVAEHMADAAINSIIIK